MLKTKELVDLVGPSLLLPPWKDKTISITTSVFLYLPNNQFLVTEDTETTDVTEDQLPTPTTTSKLKEELNLGKNTLILLEPLDSTEVVMLTLPNSSQEFLDTLELKEPKPLKPKTWLKPSTKTDPYPLLSPPMMLSDTTKPEFSIPLVSQNLSPTTPSYSLDTELNPDKITGQLKTLGEPAGEKKDTSNSLKEMEFSNVTSDPILYTLKLLKFDYLLKKFYNLIS